MRPFFIALQFLTRLPTPNTGEVSGPDAARSTVCYPLVGLLLGGLLVGVDVLARQFWPVSAASVLVLLAGVALTGALHLDGLMDTCDGVFSLKPPEQRLEILRDSRVGAFGVVGAVLLLLLKFTLLAELVGPERWRALLVMPVLGRWLLVYALGAFPYARPTGLGQIFSGQVRRIHWILASFSALILTLGLFPSSLGFGLILGSWLGATLCARFCQSRLGGLTGDTYGALNEVVEALALALVVAW
jgi:adenosylcobinamide-GDP ribazoletransferase